MTQKVIKVGTSAAVIIPKKSLQELGLKPGDEVVVEIDRKQGRVLIKPKTKINQEFLSWTQKFIEQYRPALDSLARK